MSDIHSLLKIDTELLENFYLRANYVDDYQTQKVINHNISRLKQIEESLMVSETLPVLPSDISDIIERIKEECIGSGKSVHNWTMRNLRIVAYNLVQFSGCAPAYNYALNLLDEQWKNLYFSGLMHSLLSSWHNLYQNYRSDLIKLLIKKLSAYKGSDKRYCVWQERLNFLETAGPIRVSSLLIHKNLEISETPKLLGYRPSALSYSYFSDVIVNYVVKKHIADRDQLQAIFHQHSLDRTKKLVFANLVEYEEQRGDAISRMQLCRLAQVYLGDVTLPSSWAPFRGATDEDAQKLKRAMELVNKWFTQQTIETFFDSCVNDPDRKSFWLKYVNEIDGFKIYGSSITRQILRNNSKIGPLVMRYFVELKSVNEQTSALVLYLRDKMIVEFSDVGAVYAYDKNGAMASSVKKISAGIASLKDLKDPKIGPLIIDGYYYPEGRLTHQGHWQRRLNGWLSQMVLPKKHSGSLFDRSDNVFKAKPLSSESTTARLAQTATSSTLKDERPNVAAQSGNKVVRFTERVTTYSALSKELEFGLRVVANNDGFYLKTQSNRCALIRKLLNDESPTGSIWVKRAAGPWKEIVHFFMGRERSIGFIKFSESGTILKKSLNDSYETKYIM